MLVECCQAVNVVDLQQLQPKGGLSMLCMSILGQPLDKTQQCSDWQSRPLSQQQLLYAALDAQCLVRVYEALEEQGRAALHQQHVSIERSEHN